MKVKALVSFSGAFSMYKGEVKECNDKVVLQDLLQAGYIEKVEENVKESKKEEVSEDVNERKVQVESKATKKGGKKNESKRNTGK